MREPQVDLGRQAVAEALGTGLLVAVVVGSGIMAERLTDDMALMLLGNTLPTGAMLVVLIALLGPLSGAHFNPVVTLVLAIRDRWAWRRGLAYIASQVAGGLAGTMLAQAMFGAPLLELAGQARSGAGLWLAEGVAGFGLVATILVGSALARPALPWLVGLYIVAGYWFTASTCFANPAVTLARAFTDSFSGIRLGDTPGFILAQIVGALLALALTGWLLRPLEEQAS
ncbi:MIP/aquaporin family protein [Devosia ginsengisoli]|uniref:aquaporin n=1 Tax=Devosia ginsengisoli TaxID=400770 RepID=UPI0026EA332C|nr:MIP/aquaporin family protein [Devosia ginsengisoli]MCR6656561.1 aquaporin family protein [Opitutus sp.]MCR6671000.1 aquaporin family protein [Devosia ginsengisoli]